MRHAAVLVLILLTVAGPARGQFRECASLDRLNRRLAGHVDDYTHNHGADRRVFSPILGRPRDLYVYTPPGYTPSRAYPVVLLMHSAAVDEHFFVGGDMLVELDEMVRSGALPPAVVGMPDGLIDGENRINGPHSFYLNGRFGRFEDHLLQEVMPFLSSHYSVRAEPGAHAMLGLSGGGLGASSIALRHPDTIGVVAVLSAPLNLRYGTCDGAGGLGLRPNFDPATFCWRTDYDPGEVVGVFNFGLKRVRAERHVSPVFGDDPVSVTAQVEAINPADLLLTASPAPGRPAMFVAYGGLDNWNFDAQAESFLWLARLRGFPVDSERFPLARHSLPYFRRADDSAFRWLACHLLPPVDVAPRP
jgi:S-formylglutathione hydrolase FrmB